MSRIFVLNENKTKLNFYPECPLHGQRESLLVFSCHFSTNCKHKSKTWFRCSRRWITQTTQSSQVNHEMTPPAYPDMPPPYRIACQVILYLSSELFFLTLTNQLYRSLRRSRHAPPSYDSCVKNHPVTVSAITS